jgi:uncharacterized membrane protein
VTGGARAGPGRGGIPGVVERHLRHWREAGLVSAELSEELRLSSAALAARGAGIGVRSAVTFLGGGLILSGLILIVAENWVVIPHPAKLAAWGLLQAGFVLSIPAVATRFPGRAFLGEAFAVLAGGWVLAGIALVSQIYHLNARPPNGVWFWAALVLPAAWLLGRRATSAVLFVAIVAGLTLELGSGDSWVRATGSDGPWLWLAVPLLAGTLVSVLPRPVPRLGGWIGTWVLFASQLFLLVFGASQELDRSGLGRAWLVAAPGLLAALVWPDRVLPASWDRRTGRLVLVLSLLPWVLTGERYEDENVLDLVAVGVAWVVQLAVAILVIRAGARSGSRSWVNLGYLAVLSGLLTRYFDFFGSYLEGGLALTLTGVLLLFAVFALERARRKTLVVEEP